MCCYTFLGFANVKDGCDTCGNLQWNNGQDVTESEGFWGDNQPNEEAGDCVFGHKNDVRYRYDRPYVWSFDNCNVRRSFVCERKAAPQGNFIQKIFKKKIIFFDKT